MNKVINFVKKHPKKVAAAALVVIAAITGYFDPDAAKAIGALAATLWGVGP